MRSSRMFRMLGLVATAAVLALTSACGGDDDPPADSKTGTAGAKTSAAASQAPTAKDVLAAAVKDLNAGTYTYAMKIPAGTFTGAIDPTGKHQVKVDGVASGAKYTIEGIVVGPDYFFKTSIPAAGINAKKWYKLERAKITKDEIVGLIEAKDPTASNDLVGRVVEATQSGPTTITGTYDLTKGGDLGVSDAAALKALGDKAKATPFTATLDGTHLKSLKITVPAYEKTAEYALTVDYTGHGLPVTVAAPKAADVATAPAAVYSLLNG